MRKGEPELEEFVSARTIMDALEIGRTAFYRIAKTGEFGSPVRLGGAETGRLRWPKSAYAAYVERYRVDPKTLGEDEAEGIDTPED